MRLIDFARHSKRNLSRFHYIDNAVLEPSKIKLVFIYQNPRAILCIHDLYLAPDNTPILLDELDCDKGQNSIFDCEAEWNHHNCNHGEDVIIECYPQQNIIR